MTARRLPRAAARWLTRSLRDLRGSHPVRVLRILRNLMLAAIASTLLLCLGTAVVAHHRISAAAQTRQAMADVAGARTLAQQASDELTAVFAKDPSLTDTGNAFSDAMSRLNAKIFDATLRSTAAGARGQQALGFVQGQIDTCQRLAGSAVLEYDSLHSPSADSSASACLSDPDQKVSGVSVPDTGGLTAALADLEQLEGQTLAAQHTSFWLHPLRFVWLLLAPTLAMLALLAATGRILARHFRRIISPLLLLAVADTAVVALVLSVLSSSDDAHLSANPWAAHPVTMTIEGVALVGALLLVYLGYRPRLAEYRFRTR